MTALEHNTSTPTTELDIIDAAPPTSMVVAGNTPQEILQNAARIASALKDLIEQQKLSVSMGRNRPAHVEVGGWQAAGAMLGALGGQPLHAETMWSRRIDREDVVAYEAHVNVKTLAGEIAGAAEAMCSSAEPNWQDRDEYAIRSMAETRAESRAYRRAIGWIISLAGFSPTPAEEMGAQTASGSGGEPGRTELPAWAKPVSDVSGVAQSLVNLFQVVGVDKPDEHAMRIGETIFKDCDGTIPVGMWQAINHITRELQGTSEPVGASSVDAEAISEPETTNDTNDAQTGEENDA